MPKRYYDPEYDRIVDESVIKRQYECFAKQGWFHKSYEQFRTENFEEMKDGQTAEDFMPWRCSL